MGKIVQFASRRRHTPSGLFWPVSAKSEVTKILENPVHGPAAAQNSHSMSPLPSRSCAQLHAVDTYLFRSTREISGAAKGGTKVL